jgi:hypothetical protein
VYRQPKDASLYRYRTDLHDALQGLPAAYQRPNYLIVGSCQQLLGASRRDVYGNALGNRQRRELQASQRYVAFGGLFPCQIALLPDLQRIHKIEVSCGMLASDAALDHPQKSHGHRYAWAVSEHQHLGLYV